MVTAKQFGRTQRAFDWVDVAVVGLLVALIYAMVTVAREWSGPLRPVAEIHLESRYLPLYALFSLTRGVIAYGVSFLFTLVYGYTMARVEARRRLAQTTPVTVWTHAGPARLRDAAPRAGDVPPLENLISSPQ